MAQEVATDYSFYVFICVVIGTGAAVTSLIWRIVNRKSRDLANTLQGMEDKIDKVTNALFELRGEVRGREHARMEQMFRESRSTPDE